MENFKTAGSEQNLKNYFNKYFFDGKADIEQNKIDFVANNITFESKYNDKNTSILDMYAQLIATHKKHNIPFKKYVGVFNENEISFMESKIIKKRIDSINDINWKKLTPSKIKNNETIKKRIIEQIPNDDRHFDLNCNNISLIKSYLTKIESNEQLELKEEITEDELKKTINNLNERLHKIKTLKDTDRSLFFSAIMIAIREKSPIYEVEKQISIYEEKLEDISKEDKKIKSIEFNKEAVYNISNSIIDIVDKLIKNKINTESKQKWKDQFVFIRNLNIDLYEYKNIIYLISEKIYKTFKIGQKQDILGKAYKIFLSRAGKVDNKNIILTPDHIKHLMIELADLNKDDVVLDTCMGTGGFLMEAMEKMESLDGVNEEKKNEIHNKQLIGSEIDTKLFVLACSNMFLHGDGRSQLYDKDTLNDDLTFKNGEGFFSYIKSLKPTKCIINPPYENDNCFNFTKQGLDFLEINGKLIVIIKENTFQKINKNVEDLLKNNTLDFYIKMPTNLFSEQNRSVATAIFGWTKGVPHNHNKYVKFYNLSDDGFENVPHNGRIDTKNIWKDKEKEIIEYILYDKDISDKNIAYKEKIFDNEKLLPIYHHFIEEIEPVYIEDFEDTIFDYFVYKQDLVCVEQLSKLLKEIDNRAIKRFIIRELKNGKN